MSVTQCLKVGDFRDDGVDFRARLLDPGTLGACRSADQLASVLDCFRGEQIAPYRLKHDELGNLAGKVMADLACGHAGLQVSAAAIVRGARTSDDQARSAMLTGQ